jgi:nucleoid DNA-binding protein
MVVAYEGVIMEALRKGQEVNLPGFGKFSVVWREETQRRNPATGEPVTVPAHNVVRFKLGSALKAAVSDVTDDDE